MRTAQGLCRCEEHRRRRDMDPPDEPPCGRKRIPTSGSLRDLPLWPSDVYNGTFWCRLYAGAGTACPIIKTTDAGATWTSWTVDPDAVARRPTTICARSTSRTTMSATAWIDAADGVEQLDAQDHRRRLTWSDTLSFEPGVPHNDQRPNSVVRFAERTPSWPSAEHRDCAEESGGRPTRALTWTHAPDPGG